MTSTPIVGQLFKQPFNQPLSDDGKVLAATSLGNAFRMFYLTNSTTLIPVYQDAALTTPYATGPVSANSSGQFPPIYLNPAYEYRSQLFDGNGRLLEDCDTVNNYNAGENYVAGVAMSAFKATTTIRSAMGGGSVTSDPDLSVAMPAAGTYKIDADLIFTVSAPTAVNLALSGGIPGSGGIGVGGYTGFYPAPFFGTVGGVAAAGGFLNITGAGFSGVLALNLTAGALSNVLHISGTVQFTRAAPFQLQWGAPTGAVSLLAGSSLTAIQVA